MCLPEFTDLRCLQIEDMELQLIVILLKAVLQINEQLGTNVSRDRALTAEVNLRNELTQDLKWKKAKVVSFIAHRRTLAHIICLRRIYVSPLFPLMFWSPLRFKNWK